MAFVKLDEKILDSTLWVDLDARAIFITALLMARPEEFTEPANQLNVTGLSETGFVVEPGWYGFVPSSGAGIVRRALIEHEAGIDALARLGSPDPESRTSKHEGRRLVRVDGGYVVLNFISHRDRDHTSAVRSKRYRERQKAKIEAIKSDDVTSQSEGDDTPSRDVISRKQKQKQKQKHSKEKEIEIDEFSIEDILGRAGVAQRVARDWLNARQKLKAPDVTQTVWERLCIEAARADVSIPFAVEYAAGKGWISFTAAYYFKAEGISPHRVMGCNRTRKDVQLATAGAMLGTDPPLREYSPQALEMDATLPKVPGEQKNG